MPEKKQTLTVSGYNAADLLALSYGAFLKLNWNTKYAGENILVAYTPRSWKRYDDEITIEAITDELTVTSKMIHNESYDMLGKNKKHIAEFLGAFNSIKTGATEEQRKDWADEIISLKEQTIKAAEEEVKKAAEIDSVMHLSKGNLYITYGIIGINVLVFVLMVGSGVNFFEPTGADIIKWGANFSPLTFTGDWWRLISCVFVHIGIIHLLFNMYALYMAGIYLERMLGKTRYITAYLCTGVFASLASLWWHSTPVPSAGASGAIFGMYGVFLSLLISNLIPKEIRNSLLRSILIFVGYNLIYGMKSGVDNAAHIGGLLSGLIIGYMYYLSLKSGTKKIVPMIVGILAVTVAAGFLYLQKEKQRMNPGERSEILSMLNEVKYKDGQKFLDKYEEFISIQDSAIAPLKSTMLNNEEISIQLKEKSIPAWNRADQLVMELKTYDISDKAKHKIDVMQQYIALRKEEINILLKYYETKEDTYDRKHTELVNEINSVVAELQAL